MLEHPGRARSRLGFAICWHRRANWVHPVALSLAQRQDRPAKSLLLQPRLHRVHQQYGRQDESIQDRLPQVRAKPGELPRQATGTQRAALTSESNRRDGCAVNGVN